MATELINTNNSGAMIALDPIAMVEMSKLASIMAEARVTVPKHFQGNAGDCLAVVMQSVQWGMNPFAVAQKTFLLNGILGYEAQLVSAVINAKAPIQNRLEYEYFGDWSKIIGNTTEKPTKSGGTYRVLGSTVADEKGVGVIVKATLKGETKPRELQLELAQVITRNSSLWAEDPKQQLSYLATKKWARLFCPDVILGVYTPDELGETEANLPQFLTQEVIEAVKQLGFDIKEERGYGFVVGQTFGKDKILKNLGFNYQNGNWIMELPPQEAEVIQEPTGITPPPPKPHPAKALMQFLADNGLSAKEQGEFVGEYLKITKTDIDKIEEWLSTPEQLLNEVATWREGQGLFGGVE